MLKPSQHTPPLQATISQAKDNQFPTHTEFYDFTFAGLCQAVGENAALEKVRYYEGMARKYAGSPGFIIHSCQLLTTYREGGPTQEAAPNILDRVISVFYAGARNTTRSKPLTLRQTAALIQGSTFAHETAHLRTLCKATNKAANSEYKRTAFCYATFSGTFHTRKDSDLVNHSGLICIDVDDIGERLQEVRQVINQDPATVMSFISPNGDGLKVLYEMDPATHSQEIYYKALSQHISNLCGLPLGKIDSSCKNVSRACFLPCDPELYINPDLLTDGI